MNVIEYKGDHRSLFECGKCRKVYSHIAGDDGDAQARAQAQACCNPRCRDCDAECRRGWRLCDGCLREQERQRLARVYTRAEKLAMRGWEGPVYDPYGERFYRDLEAMFEDLEDDGVAVPPYVHPCHTRILSLNLERLLEDQLDALGPVDCGEDMSWVGVPELATAVKEFNAKQTDGVWEPDMKRIIDLHSVR